MIKEIFVSFELSKLLTEKGFNPLPIGEDYIPCMYDENGKVHWGMYDPNWYWRITHQTALKWLRDNGIYITIVYGDYPSLKKVFWTPQIDSLEGFDLPDSFYKEYNTYEEATEAAIKYCLENLNCCENLIEL